MRCPSAIRRPIAHTFHCGLDLRRRGGGRLRTSITAIGSASLSPKCNVSFKRFPGNDANPALLRPLHAGLFGGVLLTAIPLVSRALKQPVESFTLGSPARSSPVRGHRSATRGYNPKPPGRKSHHPLLAVLAAATFVSHAWLRIGNTASGHSVCAFLEESFAQQPAGWRLLPAYRLTPTRLFNPRFAWIRNVCLIPKQGRPTNLSTVSGPGQ